MSKEKQLQVSMEQKICVVTGKPYNTESLLIGKELKTTEAPKYLTTGFGMSPEMEKMVEDGFVHLVEIDPTKSTTFENGTKVTPQSAFRTGRVAHIKKEVLEEITGQKVTTSVMFIDPEFTAFLETIKPKDDENPV